MSVTIIGAIERGHYVARVPSMGLVSRVPLGPIGRRIGGVEIGAVCARLGTTEISGRRWRRLKRGFKKGIKTTVKVAKKIAKSDIVRQLYNSAKAAIPAPFNAALAAVETGIRFGTAIAKGSKKARKALPVVQALAKGRIGLNDAKRLAVKAGVQPNTVRDAAAMLRLKAQAKANPRIANVFAVAKKIESAKTVPKTSKSSPASRERIITARSGRRYAVTVRRAA